MCFSATANFGGSAVIGAIGIATLRHVRQPRAVLFAALPLLFALHQFTEGFVWLGVDGDIRPEALHHVTFLFILYAQGVLPFLVPLAVLLMERPGVRRWIVLALTICGGILGVYIFYALITFQSQAIIEHHSLAYRNPATDRWWIGPAYIVATCGALVASSHRVIRWFGLLNVLGLIIILVVKSYAFTSIWCLYAALVSIIIYWQFSRRHINIAAPNSRLESPMVSQ